MMGDNIYNVDKEALKEISSEIRSLRRSVDTLIQILTHNHMTEIKTDLPKTEPIYDLITSGQMSVRAGNALIYAGIRALGDLEYVNLNDIKRIRGMGRKGLNYLNDWFKEHNITVGTDYKKDLPVFTEKEDVIFLGDSKVEAGSVVTIYQAIYYKRSGNFGLPTYLIKPKGSRMVPFVTSVSQLMKI